MSKLQHQPRSRTAGGLHPAHCGRHLGARTCPLAGRLPWQPPATLAGPAAGHPPPKPASAPAGHQPKRLFLHIGQAPASQLWASASAVSGTCHSHRVAVAQANCATVPQSFMSGCASCALSMPLLTCIVQHDVRLELLESTLQRCPRLLEVFSITCACERQSSNSSGRGSHSNTRQGVGMCMPACPWHHSHLRCHLYDVMLTSTECTLQ
jgi:hypothetical protein